MKSRSPLLVDSVFSSQSSREISGALLRRSGLLTELTWPKFSALYWIWRVSGKGVGLGKDKGKGIRDKNRVEETSNAVDELDKVLFRIFGTAGNFTWRTTSAIRYCVILHRPRTVFVHRRQPSPTRQGKSPVDLSAKGPLVAPSPRARIFS